jgi:hypothetical protein
MPQRKHYSTTEYRHEFRDPDGRFGHKPTFTGERPSATFDWDAAIERLHQILREVYGPRTFRTR